MPEKRISSPASSSSDASPSQRVFKDEIWVIKDRCRWRPTKEQIQILENLFAKGLTKPNSEQMASIAARFGGDVEGRNIYYWFQNRKSRQNKNKKLAHDRVSHGSLNLEDTERKPFEQSSEQRRNVYMDGSAAVGNMNHDARHDESTSYQLLHLFPLHPGM